VVAMGFEAGPVLRGPGITIGEVSFDGMDDETSVMIIVSCTFDVMLLLPITSPHLRLDVRGRLFDNPLASIVLVNVAEDVRLFVLKTKTNGFSCVSRDRSQQVLFSVGVFEILIDTIDRCELLCV